jgi:hypothetical protein
MSRKSNTLYTVLWQMKDMTPYILPAIFMTVLVVMSMRDLIYEASTMIIITVNLWGNGLTIN